jgi:hypothetical protein
MSDATRATKDELYRCQGALLQSRQQEIILLHENTDLREHLAEWDYSCQFIQDKFNQLSIQTMESLDTNKSKIFDDILKQFNSAEQHMQDKALMKELIPIVKDYEIELDIAPSNNAALANCFYELRSRLALCVKHFENPHAALLAFIKLNKLATARQRENTNLALKEARACLLDLGNQTAEAQQHTKVQEQRATAAERAYVVLQRDTERLRFQANKFGTAYGALKDRGLADARRIRELEQENEEKDRIIEELRLEKANAA